ncbi:methylated-DNA--[protein]-cysteine S-methyltransferase [Candidatus Kinetoplastidibacterium galati]|uniref:methylated-DNA--[protein]-cysteine S-methyltransferase n=1 Tax=Candidatus Kinetoplastidibacterium galati TCC219 TaxID=1208921 RepID=M1MC18_9PROT|nr:methylated-DNA--[protein]-cysteine S-methyltransferase [Candidatus Kinetoplastibacterium galatii]AGF49355.1 methylated-DNA-[protein]-cysteine S-methyltransferase [Candidatus Kinetoplastibacterium galatii TCC219]
MIEEREYMFYCFFESPMGTIKLVSVNDSIISVSFCDMDSIFTNNIKNHYVLKLGVSPVLNIAINQLNQWFRKERFDFDLPLKFYGTDFQKSVWSNLRFLRFGNTISYKEFSCFLGRPKSYRAVSQAISHNPILILNPCHRVVAINTELSGFSGGLSRKQQLLNHEGHLYTDCSKNSKCLAEWEHGESFI